RAAAWCAPPPPHAHGSIVQCGGRERVGPVQLPCNLPSGIQCRELRHGRRRAAGKESSEKAGIDAIALEGRVYAGKILRAVPYLCRTKGTGVDHGQGTRHTVLPCGSATAAGAAAKNLLRSLRDADPRHIGWKIGGEQMRAHRVREIGLRKSRKLGIC